jgi:hypothetical protein
MGVRHCLTIGYLGTVAPSRGRVVSVPCGVGTQPLKSPKIRRFRFDTVEILAIYGETRSEMRKLTQICITRVFGLQYVFYGVSVGGGVSEIRLPVVVTYFSTNVA